MITDKYRKRTKKVAIERSSSFEEECNKIEFATKVKKKPKEKKIPNFDGKSKI